MSCHVMSCHVNPNFLSKGNSLFNLTFRTEEGFVPGTLTQLYIESYIIIIILLLLQNCLLVIYPTLTIIVQPQMESNFFFFEAMYVPIEWTMDTYLINKNKTYLIQHAVHFLNKLDNIIPKIIIKYRQQPKA